MQLQPADGVATPDKIYFATGNQKKLQEVRPLCRRIKTPTHHSPISRLLLQQTTSSPPPLLLAPLSGGGHPCARRDPAI